MARHPGYPGPPQLRAAPNAKREKRGRKLERRPSEFGAPRRYGIGTILIVTLAMAMLLGAFNWFGAPSYVVIGSIVFLGLVALGQTLLYQGVRPRAASVVTGATVFPLGMILFNAIEAALGVDTWRNITDPLTFFLFLCLSIPGAALGYLAGGMVAGIFLVMDAVQRALEKPIEAELVAEDSSPDDSLRDDPQPITPERVDPPVPDDQNSPTVDVHPLDR